MSFQEVINVHMTCKALLVPTAPYPCSQLLAVHSGFLFNGGVHSALAERPAAISGENGLVVHLKCATFTPIIISFQSTNSKRLPTPLGMEVCFFLLIEHAGTRTTRRKKKGARTLTKPTHTHANESHINQRAFSYKETTPAHTQRSFGTRTRR